MAFIVYSSPLRRCGLPRFLDLWSRSVIALHFETVAMFYGYLSTRSTFTVDLYVFRPKSV